jgi:sterol desaturase/sphingolipid hydroxylase (fatty acid hydroxylase superfamily)
MPMDFNFLTIFNDSLARVYIFIGLGLSVWLVSKYYPMKEYVNQKITLSDYCFILIAMVIAGLYEMLITPVIQYVFRNSTEFHAFLMQAVDEWGLWFQIPAYLLVTDFLGYCFHRLMHTRAFWRVHSFHHSIQSLNWIAGVRGSPLHIFLVILPSMLTSSIFLLTDQSLAFYCVVFFDICSQHLTHSNVYLPYATQLEKIVVTPRMHFIHHHIDERYGARNFGFYFSIWDHLLGTYVNADDVSQKGQLGLTNNYSTSSLFWGVRLQEKTPNK